MTEKILCAAIWYKDLPTQKFKAINLDKGLIVCGHRHGHCIDIMVSLAKLRTVTFSPDGVGEHEQGFLTNLNRFVNREDAYKIALEQKQMLFEHKTGTLFSEDLGCKN